MAHEDDRLASLSQACHRTHDRGLVQRIKRTRGLIEQHERGIAQKDARKAKTLTLTTRKRIAQLGDGRFIAVGKPGDESTERSRLASLVELLVRRIGAGDAQVVSNRPNEQVSVLRHVGLVCAQARRVDVANALARNPHDAIARVPEAHEQLEQRRLSRTGTARDAHHLARWELARDALENRGGRPLAIGEVDVFHRCAAELDIDAVSHVLALRSLIQKVEHASTRRKRRLERGTKTPHRHDGTKGGEEGERRHERRAKRHAARRDERDCRAEHHEASHEYERVTDSLRGGLTPLETNVNGAHGIRELVEPTLADGRGAVLNRLGHSAQAIEHICAQATRSTASLRRHERHADADNRVGSKRDERHRGIDASDKDRHDRDARDGNGDGRDRMRVEDLKELDVGRDEAHDVTLATALELGRGKTAQGAKDEVAHMRE